MIFESAAVDSRFAVVGKCRSNAGKSGAEGGALTGWFRLKVYVDAGKFLKRLGRLSAGEGRYGPGLAMDLPSPAVACVAHFGNDNHADGMVR